MKKVILVLVLFIYNVVFSQTDLDKILKGGELILGGITIMKTANSVSKPESKVIQSMCVKNKLTNKITFKISGKDEEGNEIKKELVIQKEGKECLFELQKGIYSYEIVLANNETYKKGEYKFDDEITITVKE
jgi:hypothetical protein